MCIRDRYTSCCNTDKGIYYYTTYNNHQITAVNMFKENLDGAAPVSYTHLDVYKRQDVHAWR